MKKRKIVEIEDEEDEETASEKEDEWKLWWGFWWCVRFYQCIVSFGVYLYI
jgi:hypothetical protein